MGGLRFTRNEIASLIDKVLGQIINKDESAQMSIGEKMDTWEWESGVALFAMYLYCQKTGRKDIYQYLIEWFDGNIEKGLPAKNVNTVCPLLTLTYIYERENKKKYLDICKEWLGYVMAEMPRTEEAGLQHIVSNSVNEAQLWDDTLYMSVLFLCRMGIILANDAYIQESIRQFLVHLKYLTDPKTGLLFHGWGFKEKSHFAGALWGRGNGWFGASLVDYMEMIELPEGVKMFLLTSFQRQIKALVGLQSHEGLWHTLLDDPASYLETSGSAAFAYSMLKGIRKGYIDQGYIDAAEKGVRGVIGKIDSHGLVQGVSYGTAMGFTLQHYRDIEIKPMPYGQTLTMLMLVELLNHLD
jgi:Predicted unsaturated glucuronyl hydrolase involved in regulation of bacterial surface properties, and related proteins